MNIFQAMNFVTRTLSTLMFLGVLIAVGFIVYVRFIYKPKPERQKYEVYENFERRNVRDYIPIKWIKDSVILMEDGITYVAVVYCKGFEFFFSHPKEQLAANLGYVDFVQALSQPIQLRMSTKQEDLEGPIAESVAEKNRIDRKMLELLDEAALLESSYDVVDEETKAAYAEKMIQYDKIIRNLEWESLHAEQTIEYMREISSSHAAPTRETCYVVDWVYNANEFPEGTTQEDIFKRAKKELNNKVESMRRSLSVCNTKVIRANDKELRELIRGHMKPFGKNIFKASDLEKSNFDEMIVTSNSLQEARQNFNEFMRRVAEVEERKKNVEGAAEEWAQN